MNEVQHGKVSKAFIVHKAADLFKQKGYWATSMEDIASVVGIKKSSLYYYIRSKEELLYEVGRLTMKLLLESAEEIAFTSDPPVKKLKKLIFSHIHLICENMHLFTTGLLELNPTNIPYYWKEIVALRDRYEGLLRNTIKAGMETQILRSMDEKMVVLYLLGSMNWLIRWYSANGNFSPENISSTWQDVFLNGLLVRDIEIKK
jgi:AcrR family transcriptional regulator